MPVSNNAQISRINCPSARRNRHPGYLPMPTIQIEEAAGGPAMPVPATIAPSFLGALGMLPGSWQYPSRDGGRSAISHSLSVVKWSYFIGLMLFGLIVPDCAPCH